MVDKTSTAKQQQNNCPFTIIKGGQCWNNSLFFFLFERTLLSLLWFSLYHTFSGKKWDWQGYSLLFNKQNFSKILIVCGKKLLQKLLWKKTQVGYSVNTVSPKYDTITTKTNCKMTILSVNIFIPFFIRRWVIPKNVIMKS